MRQTPTGHAGLVLPPLFLTMVFCFALVLIQQHQMNNRAAAKKTYEKAHSKLSPTSLKTITPLQPVSVASPSSSGAAANPAAVKTSAPPQPSKTSGKSVQGAAQNTQPNSVIHEVTKPVTSKLNNL